jgi:hypothetical protein
MHRANAASDGSDGNNGPDRTKTVEEERRRWCPHVSPPLKDPSIFVVNLQKKRDIIESMLLCPELSSLLGLPPSHHCSPWTKRARRGDVEEGGAEDSCGYIYTQTTYRQLENCTGAACQFVLMS